MLSLDLPYTGRRSRYQRQANARRREAQAKDDLHDFLDNEDIPEICQWCRQPLPEDVHDTFCSEECADDAAQYDIDEAERQNMRF